jgi:hypothetical protein
MRKKSSDVHVYTVSYAGSAPCYLYSPPIEIEMVKVERGRSFADWVLNASGLDGLLLSYLSCA